MNPTRLTAYLETSALQFPQNLAVCDGDGATVTYSELNRQADALAVHLCASGIRRGDRVGVVLPKSLASIVALFGIMKAGAAYVPVDFTAPVERGRTILDDCGIRGLIVDSRRIAVSPANEKSSELVAVVVVGPPDTPLQDGQTAFESAINNAGEACAVAQDDSDLAYILYTSGSTGDPKGVMLSHVNAVSFVEWASSVFTPSEYDRFSSHAPLHFDLSILDIYLAIKHGASVHLISEELGKNPRDLARFIAARSITIWYSTPSILNLLVQSGHLERHDFSTIRTVLFAGEVFPVKQLRLLSKSWRGPSYYNLYGPTETNVCTFAKIPAVIQDDREVPYPIGPACSHCAALVLDSDMREVPSGDEGLLYISGPSVFSGYWNRPMETAAAFHIRDGVRWYNTGDLVRWNADEGFTYAGRKDRMVKRRGYRIELGEVERALYAHSKVDEAAIVSLSNPDRGTEIVAFLTCKSAPMPSIIELKTFCGTKIPAYMIPDRFVYMEGLPRTSTNKVDYQDLKRALEVSHVA